MAIRVYPFHALASSASERTFHNWHIILCQSELSVIKNMLQLFILVRNLHRVCIYSLWQKYMRYQTHSCVLTFKPFPLKEKFYPIVGTLTSGFILIQLNNHINFLECVKKEMQICTLVFFILCCLKCNISLLSFQYWQSFFSDPFTLIYLYRRQ